MNTDTINGAATDFGGQVKQGLGAVLGDKSMQAEGKGEQLSGKTQKVFGDAKDSVDQAVRPLLDQARQFVKDRPFASAALGGVLGLALINTLRGK
ncbi:CsbD family protein [Sphingomonas fuzhouensis]|uniref:CsbD family protein n=1 Tax=Sphingomonas fuzhouensis TaxID=3106033 RepID=UPI002AFEEFC2|nr:CsbD family protein [Sphingomonas sp. SGZ-02]